MNFHDVRLLYLREVRAALRERGIVINSILVPLLMYPTIMWGVVTVLVFMQGQEERFVSRIAFLDLPAEHAALRDEVTAQGPVEIVSAPAPERLEEAVAAGEVDAVAEVLPPADAGAALPDNFRVRVTYDASKDRSAKAQERLSAAIADYRDAWVRREAEALGVDAGAWEQVRIERRDLATSGEKGAFLLGLLAPLLMIVMVAAGSVFPAIDATAGERERSTWETTMTLAVPRSAILTAKYLYVATFGWVAGMLNLLAMALAMRAIVAPLLGSGEEDVQFHLPLTALPLLAVAVALLALFIAAGMMLFASFARTFKEGQAMVAPFYLICLLPAMLVQSPDLVLDARFALIPIANVSLLFRDLISGVFNWPMIALTLLAEAAVVGLCLRLARWVLGFEDVLIGSYSGSFLRFLGARLRPGRRELSDRARP